METIWGIWSTLDRIFWMKIEKDRAKTLENTFFSHYLLPQRIFHQRNMSPSKNAHKSFNTHMLLSP